MPQNTTIQERLEAFWAGEQPDQIPYTIYENEWKHEKHDPAWQLMYAKGLGVTFHLDACRVETHNMDIHTTEYTENGNVIRVETRKTPMGPLTQKWVNGWHHEYLLKCAADYRVMTYIVEHTDLFPCYGEFHAREQAMPPAGIALTALGRTPLQTMLVDLAGLENFAFHLTDFEGEVRELYDALLKQFRRRTEIVATGPGRFVSNLENFTAESLGPRRYKEFLLPVYQESFPVLHDAGKIVGTHYDGRTKSCRHLIAESPIDLIESLTEPPEGDQTIAECRAVWPEKLFWCNIRVGDYQLAPDRLKAKVLQLVRDGAPDGRRFAFEVSEHLPQNWKESIPIVLDALQETGVG